MSDQLVFVDELPTASDAPLRHDPWVVLIVDDEPAVHEVTELVMSGFEMERRPLEFLHCYSAAQARTLLASRDDIALILLDVVMETEHAGLELARYIREDLRNLKVRIVLRTGQSGQAPEEHVIRDYDINDYKEKTELTRRKLITVFYAALRAYRDLLRIEQASAGLRRSIEAITRVSDSDNLRTFASALFEQLNYLLNLNGEGICASHLSAYTASSRDGQVRVLAATQAYSGLHTNEQIDNLPDAVRKAFHWALTEKASHHGERDFLGYYRTRSGNENTIYMVFPQPISDSARELLEIFSKNVAMTFDSLLMREEIEGAQRASTILLGLAIERQLDTTGSHASRAGDIAALLATHLGMTGREIEFMRQAMALHDVGKIGVPDTLLAQPGPLTPEQWDLMKTHAKRGFDLLCNSSSPVHRLGAIMAHEHHERWDGCGYPRGLAGEQIHLAGRIAALADVLDALVSASSFKAAWPLADAVAHIRAESGTHFEPRLVDLLLKQLGSVKAIYGHLPASAQQDA